MFDRCVFVVELPCKITCFLDGFGAFTRKIGVAARYFGKTVQFLFQHRAQCIDVYSQFLQQVHADAVVFGDDGVQDVQWLYGLLVVARGTGHRILQCLLCLNG